MLKNIRFRKECYTFKKGVNYIDDINVIDIAITSLGCFTSGFTNGNGRRIDLFPDENEISINTCSSFNHKNFDFTRCYTNFRIDTETLDKKQDINKYAIELNKKLENKKIHLPIVSYYNNVLTYEPFSQMDDANSVVKDRSYGYNNCLIVKNKFEYTQQYLIFLLIIALNYQLVKFQDDVTKNFSKTDDFLVKSLNNFGYKGYFYNLLENKIQLVDKNNKIINIEDIKDKSKQIYISIIFDLSIRALMLNPNSENPFEEEGCVAITYPFKTHLKNKLIDEISTNFPNIQLLVLK